MINYWRFRYHLYHYSLKVWLENIKQTSIAIVALFPLALPALVFIPFVFIGIIVKPETSPESFFNTLWGYLLLMYTWVSYQREGILATRYSHYMASLPNNKFTKVVGDVGVTLYVANFFVVAPILLSVYALTNFTGNDSEASAVLVSMGSLALLSCYYCVAAVKFTPPWLSLFTFPILVAVLSPELTKLQFVVTWLLIILLEHTVKIRGDYVKLKPTGLTYLFVKWELKYSENNKLILVIFLLLLSMSKVIAASVPADTARHFINFSAFLFGIVLAANLFSVQKLKTEFQTFLATYPVADSTMQLEAVKYTLLKLSLALAILLSADLFSIEQWLVFTAVYGVTVLSIIKWPSRFILLPIAIGMTLVLVNSLSS